jgi:hypothetical protein
MGKGVQLSSLAVFNCPMLAADDDGYSLEDSLY